MAWLNATPKPPPGSKLAEAWDQSAALSRIDRLKKDGVQPSMPPNPAPHIIERLLELGISEAAGMGAAPLSWREIDAWCNRTAVDLAPWEARLLRSLSVAYLAEGRRAENETCPPPWLGNMGAAEIKREIAVLDMVLG